MSEEQEVENPEIQKHQQSDQSQPITASPQKSNIQLSPCKAHIFQRTQESNNIENITQQYQEALNEQERQHKKNLEMYNQIIRFYDQNLINLKNIVIQKEQEITAKNQQLQNMQKLIQQIQQSFYGICQKYESENSELMQRYLMAIDDFNLRQRNPSPNNNPQTVLEIVTLKEKLVEVSAMKSQLELTVKELSIKCNQQDKMLHELQQTIGILQAKVNFKLSPQQNQNQYPPQNQYTSQNQSQYLSHSLSPQRDQTNNYNKFNNNNSFIYEQQTYGQQQYQYFNNSSSPHKDSLMQKYRDGSHDKNPQLFQVSTERNESNKSYIEKDIQNLLFRRSQLENEVHKYPLHARNLNEKRKKQLFEDELEQIETQIQQKRAQLSQYRY